MTSTGSSQAKASKQSAGKDDVVQLKKQVSEFRELAARAQADLQNAKARMEKQAAEFGNVVLAEFLRSILPTLDAFQRAFQHLPEDLKNHEWVKGVIIIEQGLLRQVEFFGLKRLESLGQPLDPHHHEVLMNAPGEPGVVVDVVEEGYEFRGKVLRSAKVKVGMSSGSGSGSAAPRTERSSGAGVTSPTSPPAPPPTSGEAGRGQG